MEPKNGDEAIVAALDGIVRMQKSIRGGLDICVETGLVFLRVYYQQLPPNVARRLTELDPSAVESIQTATAHHGTAAQREALGAVVAGDAAFAQAIRAANVYREKLGYGLLGPDGTPEPEGGAL